MKYFFLILFYSLSVHALKLEKIQTITLPKDSFKSFPFGGISAIAFQDQKMWMLCDDPGRKAPPRIYLFEVSYVDHKFILKPSKTIQLMSQDTKFFFDGEGMVLDSGFNFILSSEGNTNAKPRKNPRLVRMDQNGKILSELEIPSAYMPESQGLQKIGTQLNAGFEGLTRWNQFLFAAMERPLAQDLQSSEENHSIELLRWLKYSIAGGKSKLEGEYLYPIDKIKRDGKLEYQKGISEILAINESHFLVLERSLEISAKGLRFDSHLFQAQMPDLKLELPRAKITEEDYTKEKWISKSEIKAFDEKEAKNFESLSWGPPFVGAPKTLWIGNDNNFSSNEENSFLIFKVIEE